MTNIYNLIAILVFKFVSVAFLAYFLRKEDKQALLSLLLEALGGGSREADNKEADGEETDSKVVHSKDTGSEKVRGFLADFALSIFLLSTKSYKERFGIYFLKLY